MRQGCPGQDSRWRTVELYTCPHCGAEEEIWSHERKVKCPGCGEWIFKQDVPSCTQWCGKASECVGEIRWKKLLEGDQ